METVNIDGVEYELIDTTIGEIEETDLVIGSDGKWHKQVPLEPKEAERMFRIWFKLYPGQPGRGQYAEADDGHLWTLVDPRTNIPMTLSTLQLLESFGDIKDFPVGKKDGLFLSEIEEIPTQKIRSITVQNDDSLFQIQLNPADSGEESWGVLTHNCDFRMVAGRLGAIASRMMFDNMKATTIDGNHKGAGMARISGSFYGMQIYYEEVDWLTNWYKDRGLNEHGLDVQGGDFDRYDPNANVDLGEDEEITLEDKKDEIEFQDLHATIDNTKKQKFEEI